MWLSLMEKISSSILIHNYFGTPLFARAIPRTMVNSLALLTGSSISVPLIVENDSLRAIDSLTSHEKENVS